MNYLGIWHDDNDCAFLQSVRLKDIEAMQRHEKLMEKVNCPDCATTV